MTVAPPSPRIQQAYGLLRAHRFAEAESLCRQELATTPDAVAALSLLARVLNLSGRAADAWIPARRSVELAPDFVPGWIEVAALARKKSDHASAAQALTRLCQLQPQQPAFVFDLVQTRIALGDKAAAHEALLRLQQLAPNIAEAHVAAAQVAALDGDYAAALRGFDAVLAVAADRADALAGRARALLQLDRYREAGDAYQRALAKTPNDAGLWDGYASALQKGQGNPHEMARARREVVRLDPENGLAWHYLGDALRSADQLAEGLRAFEKAYAIDNTLLAARWCAFQYPDSVVYPNNAERERFHRRWLSGLATFEALDFSRAEFKAELPRLVASPTNFFLHYLGQAFVDEQRRYAAVLDRVVAQAMPAPQVRTSMRARRRIGIASPFLYRHTVSKLFLPMFEALAGERFEFHAFYLEDKLDATAARWQKISTRHLSGQRDPVEWSRLIAESELDVLIILDVGMHPTPQVLAAQRFAPLQCVLWGHPVTSGSRHIDYFLTSDLMEHADGAADYTEQLVRLPNLGCVFAPPDAQAEANFAIAARTAPDSVHYFVAQSVYKLIPDFDDALARIAEGVPNARFSFTPHCPEPLRQILEARFLAAFQRRGIDGRKHLHVLGRLKQEQFLAVAADADVNLDSFGWSGGNTTLEISWFNTPTLTLPGTLMRSRHSYAINRRLDLDELIATDADDYVRRAIELGRNPGLRRELRAKIAERKHLLYNDAAVSAALGEFLATAVTEKLQEPVGAHPVRDR